MKTTGILLICILILPISCKSKKTTASGGVGNDRTIAVKMLNSSTYLLTETSTDSTYAFTESNPVKVGEFSPRNEQLYLNALLGPEGQLTKYNRTGSCCAFKTPNAMIGGMGLLDRYMVTYVGSKDTFYIYINMYDKGNLYIPKGFTARK